MRFLNFSKNNDSQTIDINGYIMVKESGELIKVPIGLSTYEIPPEVKKISISVLNSMAQSAIEVDFSNNPNIASLPFGAFSRFIKLSKVVLPTNLKMMEMYFDHNSLSRGIEIVLPNNLEQFAQNQFSSNAVRLELEDTVMNIKGGIVSHNNILEELVVSGKVQRLEKYCVNQVKFLKKIWLKEGIIAMDREAIRGCNNLTEIHIPSSLKLFSLGADDYRPVKEFKLNSKKYNPSQEQIETEKNRVIKLYKKVNGEEIIFEVNRNSFETMLETPIEFVFEGYGHSYRLNKEILGSCRYFLVDIARKIVNRNSESRFVDESFTGSSMVEGTKGETMENNCSHLNNINILGRPRQGLNTKNIIERLLNIVITASEKVKDTTSGNIVTILRTQRELSDEMESSLEALEECYNENQIDTKTYLEYSRYIKNTYKNLISHAPVERQIIDVLKIDDEKIDDWKLKLMKKYDRTLEEIEALLRESEGSFRDEVESNDMSDTPRRL